MGADGYKLVPLCRRARQTPAMQLVGNPGHAITKPAHLEIALSVAPRLNQMNEICAAVIKAMRFGIIVCAGELLQLDSSLSGDSHVQEPPAPAPARLRSGADFSPSGCPLTPAH